MNNTYFWKRVKDMAHGRWQDIHRRLGIPEAFLNPRKHSPCPSCGGRDRYRYTDYKGEGGYICNQCGAGNGFDLLMLVYGYGFKSALQDVASVLGLSSETPCHPLPKPVLSAPPPVNPKDRIHLIQRLWSETQPLNDSLALHYLRNRGLTLKEEEIAQLNQHLRYHEHMAFYGDNGEVLGYFPAMVGLITDHSGQAEGVRGLHRTYLTAQGQKLSQINGKPVSAKKMLARYPHATNGASVPLFPLADSEVLGIGEGIETTLAGREIVAMHTQVEIPVFATLSAGGIARFEIPQSVKHLFIFTDNDHSRAGQKATAALAKRAQNITITQLAPPAVGMDALDYLNQSKGGV